jgi:nucleoside-diphosphate-sugar epimerase
MIMITGAGGFIGKRLTEAMSHTYGGALYPVYHAQDCTVSDTAAWCNLNWDRTTAALLSHGVLPNTVIHLAGVIKPKERYTTQSCIDMYRSNVLSTFNVLDYCINAGVDHLIFASSQSVYGVPDEQPLTEQSRCNPMTHYAMSKLCCEQILKAGSNSGLNVTVLRIPGVFDASRRNGTVFEFCVQALTEGHIHVDGCRGLIPIDILSLDQVVAAIMNSCMYPSSGYRCMNISSGEPCSLDLIARRVAELVPGCSVHESECPQPVVQLDTTLARQLIYWQSDPMCIQLSNMLEGIRHAT